MADQKIIVGSIILTLLLSGVIYIELSGSNLKIKVDNDKSTFYIFENNNWVTAGVETNSLYSGTTKISKNSTIISYEYDNFTKRTQITRTSIYKNNEIIKDVYVFDGTSIDKEKFPIFHTVEIFNAPGKIFQYDASNLDYSGITQSVLDKQFYVFGKKIKIRWDPGQYFAKITKLSTSGKLTLKYKINSSYQKYEITLFDPDEEPPCTRTAYYLSTSLGSDSSSTCNVTNPCYNLSKTNSLSLQPGDCVFLRRDDIWRKQFSYSGGGGNSTAQITFGAYGNGTNKPRIFGSINASDPAYWTNLSGGLWESQANFTNEVYQIFYNVSAGIQNTKYGQAYKAITDLGSNWDFFWNSTSKKITIYQTDGNPGTVGNGIELPAYNSTYECLIYAYRISYLTFRDWEIDFARMRAVCASSGSSSAGIGWNVSNNTLNFNFAATLNIDSNGASVDGNTFYWDGLRGLDTPTGAGGSGECIWVPDTTNISVTNNNISYCGGVNINFWHSSNIYAAGNHISNGAENIDHSSGIYGDGCDNMLIFNNTIDNLSIGMSVGNEISGYDSVNNTFAYNVVTRFRAAGLNIDSAHNSSEVINTTANHNTFYMADNYVYSGGWNRIIRVRYHTNVNFIDNLVTSNYTNTTYGYLLYVENSSTYGTGWVSDYNEFNSTQGRNAFYFKGSTYTSLSSYVSASGQDTHSITKAPHFTNVSAGDYHPVFGSDVCTASSTASYLGALPCTEEINETPSINYTENIPYFNNYENSTENQNWYAYDNSSVCGNIGSPTLPSNWTTDSTYYSSASTAFRGGEYDDPYQVYLVTPSFVLDGTSTGIKLFLRYKYEVNYDGMYIEYRYNDSATWTKVTNASTTGVYFTSPPFTTYEGYGGHGTSMTSCITGMFSSADSGNKTINLSVAPSTGNISLRFVSVSDNSVTCTSSPCGSWIDDFNITYAPINDTTPPTVNMITTSFNTTTSTPSLSFNFTDAISNSSNCTAYFNNTIKANNASVRNNTLTILTSSNLSLGTYSVFINCTDLSSNIGKSGVINVTIQSLPNETIVSVIQSFNSSATRITFPYNISSINFSLNISSIKLLQYNVSAQYQNSSVATIKIINNNSNTIILRVSWVEYNSNYSIRIASSSNISNSSLINSSSLINLTSLIVGETKYYWLWGNYLNASMMININITLNFTGKI